MSVPIKVPDLGAADDNVTIVRWLVSEGATITRGQKIVAIETDKAIIELESVAAGVLLKRCTAEGDDARVGDVIAIVGKAEESLATSDDAGLNAATSDASANSGQVTERVASKIGGLGERKPRVSPLVRNFAKQQGVDLDRVVGTGPGGIVTRQDVLSTAKRAGDRG